VPKANNFGRNSMPVPRRKDQTISYRYVGAKPVYVDDQAGRPGDVALQGQRRDPLQSHSAGAGAN
jgi:hypothetical protein